MSSWQLDTGECVRHLVALGEELAWRGVWCVVDDRGLWPRLRIYCPGEDGASAEFDNNVVAARLDGRWCFCWPSAVPIGPVTCVADAAEEVVSDLGIAAGPDGGGGQAVVYLPTWRVLHGDKHAVPSVHTVTAAQARGAEARSVAAGTPQPAAAGTGPGVQLTERERHVLEELCRPECGLAASWQVAAALSVDEATVRQHLSHLYRKLGVPPGPDRRARLAWRAGQLGLAGQPRSRRALCAASGQDPHGPQQPLLSSQDEKAVVLGEALAGQEIGPLGRAAPARARARQAIHGGGCGE